MMEKNNKGGESVTAVGVTPLPFATPLRPRLGSNPRPGSTSCREFYPASPSPRSPRRAPAPSPPGRTHTPAPHVVRVAACDRGGLLARGRAGMVADRARHHGHHRTPESRSHCLTARFATWIHCLTAHLATWCIGTLVPCRRCCQVPRLMSFDCFRVLNILAPPG